MTILNTSIERVGKSIEYSVLGPQKTIQDLMEGCEIAKKYSLAAVCVKPCDVVRANEILKSTNVLVGTVISFPHGDSTTEAKITECLQAIEDGASELDVVINIGYLKSGQYDQVEQELKDIVKLSKIKYSEVVIKIIIETGYLTSQELDKACELCYIAGADFIGTATGFGPINSNFPFSLLPKAMKLKVTDNIKNLDQVLHYLDLGVDRISISSVNILLEI